jgi:hypothetical protein
MGKVSLFCVLLVLAILLDDGSSIRKTEDEKKEEEELAKAVNATLAEEKKRQEEEDEKRRQEDEKKRTEDEAQKKKKDKDGKERAIVEKQEGQDEACPPVNNTCPPVNNTCPIVEPCPKIKECHECPAPKDCPPVEECGPCPEVRPCKPCPVDNTTRVNLECPSSPSCTESSGMSVPVAMVVGASISLVTMGAAATVGLILRYVPPLISGIFFLSIVFVVWFLSSHYPDAARELGARAATLLREAATVLSHRVMEAIQRHNEQVGFLFQS